MAEVTEGRSADDGDADGTGDASLYESVLDAMTTGMAVHADSVTTANVRVPAAEPITATSREVRTGEAIVRYHLGDHLIASQTFRVDERGGEVILGQFALGKYESLYNGVQNVTGIHERFVANLTDAGVACMLRTTVSGEHSVLWAPYFDWDTEMANANAANLGDAVESLYPIVVQQTVWDASDLPERIKLIASPDAEAAGTGPARPGSWRHLIAATTPAQLADGINAINPGLAKAIFARMSAWYAQRVIS